VTRLAKRAAAGSYAGSCTRSGFRRSPGDADVAWGVVHCSRAFGDAQAARTMEDEVVRLVPVSDVPTAATVPSVRWLVPMALDPERVEAVVRYRPAP